MADLSITASAVRGSNHETGLAGATLTAGKVVYRDASNNLQKADCDAGSPANVPIGILVNGGDSGQPLIVHERGNLTVNAVLTAGTFYYLSATAGGICPFADLTTLARIVQIGYATSTTNLFVNIIDTGVTL